ncbi:hypothetical protein FRB99_008044 [Tulasnella sp. 403]|nr:hypothetical protein FRB99_008044 [Tulasnella sp. 403]
MSSKKGAKAQAVEATYQIRDIVLAKVKGYPPWPAMIVDPEKVNKAVKKERPISKKTTFYCVRFFPAGDYSWAVAKDLSRLLPHEMEAYLNEPSKKNGDLKRGYEIALNPTPWEEELERRQAEYEAAAAEEEEGVDQLEESEAGEDELDSDADSSSTKKKKKTQGGKKRKRENVSAEEQKKRRRSAQEALSAKRRPTTTSKRGSKGKTSSEHVESEDGDAYGEGEDAPGSSGKKSTKASKSKAADGDEKSNKRGGKKDKDDGEDAEDDALYKDPEAVRVKEWRHRLQRAFLTTKSPVASDMPALDQIFHTVETYENLTIDYLQFSKIGKVMRRIASLQEIPRDDEFHFRDRAQTLVTKWQAIIAKAEQEAKDKESEAATNGKPAEAPTSGVTPTEKSGESKAGANGVANGKGDQMDILNGDADKVAPAADADSADKKDEAMDMSDS